VDVKQSVVFYPASSPHALGHPRLDAILFAEPTGADDDLISADFVVAAGEGDVERLSVVHPWPWPGHYRVGADNVVMLTRHQETVEAFTWGGELEITTDEARTVCSLTSSAPIVDLDDLDSIEDHFATSFDAVLAGWRSQWRREDITFDAHLATIEPAVLYAVALTEMEQHIHQVPVNARDDRHWRLSQAIHQSIRLAKEAGDWPTLVPTVTDLLA
jgi:hypothetical protein